MQKILLSFLLMSILLFACEDPKNFEFKGMQEIQVSQLGMGKNTIHAKLKYYNPNHFSMILKKVDCDILMNNQPFTRVHLDTNFVIPAQSQFLVPAKMEFEMSNLVKNSVDILFNRPIKLNINGNATLSKGMFTKTLPIAFETTQKLNLASALSK